MIETLLKVEDEALLKKAEALLSKEDQESPAPRRSFKDFAGIWTEEEAEKMKKDIEEACG